MTGSDLPRSSGGERTQNLPRIRLRLLETTDVHANLLPYDYYADDCETSYGLARTATLIWEARAQSENCLLLDNGDFLQGTPLSDLATQPESGWTGPHPAITAMNYLQYDAAALGNHEFNFGLDWLQSALADAGFPVICANVATQLGPTPCDDETLYPPYALMRRRLRASDGCEHDICIGVLGLLPPQIAIWDHFHLEGRVQTRDIVETARARVPEMRRKGADIVIVLAHTGIDPDEHYLMKENAALDLGHVPGIDAILAGHTHEVFPVPGEENHAGADHNAGTFNGTPAVMAGFRGAYLGVLDLDLEPSNKGWRVTGHHSEVRRIASSGDDAPAEPDNDLKVRLWPVHQRTLNLIGQPLGRSAVPLHSYLALVRNDPATQLVTRAQRAAVAQLMHDTADARMPILSASAPFKTGGRGGPTYYSDIPPGDIRLRNAADLYAFPNTLCVMRMTGAQLRDWLERAAVCFNRIMPGRADQPLYDPQVPGHSFDIIDGLTYRIDLSQPARYDRNGNLVNPSAQRIVELRHDGQAVAEDAEFLMAANSFRAHGGGPYPRFPDKNFVLRSRTPIRSILTDYIRETGVVPALVEPVFSFAPMPGSSVVFETGPGIRNYPGEVAALNAEDLGDTEAGFARFRLLLG